MTRDEILAAKARMDGAMSNIAQFVSQDHGEAHEGCDGEAFFCFCLCHYPHQEAAALADLALLAWDMAEALERSAMAANHQCDQADSFHYAQPCDCVGDAVRAALARFEEATK